MAYLQKCHDNSHFTTWHSPAAPARSQLPHTSVPNLPLRSACTCPKQLPSISVPRASGTSNLDLTATSHYRNTPPCHHQRTKDPAASANGCTSTPPASTNTKNATLQFGPKSWSKSRIRILKTVLPPFPSNHIMHEPTFLDKFVALLSSMLRFGVFHLTHVYLQTRSSSP